MKNFPHSGMGRRLFSRGLSGDGSASRRRSNRRAFTLIELLTVATIIAVLAAILVPVAGSMMRKGKVSREINAGRQIMVAYVAYAGENNGQLLPGYDKNVGSVTLPDGKQVSGIMCARYPWRLAPYIGGAMDDIFLINDTRKKTDRLKHESPEYQYLASLFPALGINAYCVGGYDDASGEGHFSTDVVRTLAGASRSSKLIVFASARYTEKGKGKGKDTVTPGFHLVSPPKLGNMKWSQSFDPKKTSSSYGNVDLRWDGKAVCAFLDGHVEMLGEPQIADMRLWSNTAAEDNNEFYSVPR